MKIVVALCVTSIILWTEKIALDYHQLNLQAELLMYAGKIDRMQRQPPKIGWEISQ